MINNIQIISPKDIFASYDMVLIKSNISNIPVIIKAKKYKTMARAIVPYKIIHIKPENRKLQKNWNMIQTFNQGYNQLLNKLSHTIAKTVLIHLFSSLKKILPNEYDFTLDISDEYFEKHLCNPTMVSVSATINHIIPYKCTIKIENIDKKLLKIRTEACNFIRCQLTPVNDAYQTIQNILQDVNKKLETKKSILNEQKTFLNIIKTHISPQTKVKKYSLKEVSNAIYEINNKITIWPTKYRHLIHISNKQPIKRLLNKQSIRDMAKIFSAQKHIKNPNIDIVVKEIDISDTIKVFGVNKQNKQITIKLNKSNYEFISIENKPVCNFDIIDISILKHRVLKEIIKKYPPYTEEIKTLKSLFPLLSWETGIEMGWFHNQAHIIGKQNDTEVIIIEPQEKIIRYRGTHYAYNNLSAKLRGILRQKPIPSHDIKNPFQGISSIKQVLEKTAISFIWNPFEFIPRGISVKFSQHNSMQTSDSEVFKIDNIIGNIHIKDACILLKQLFPEIQFTQSKLHNQNIFLIKM